MTRKPGLVISAVDFGWGSAGKLNAILEALAGEYRLVVLGSRLARPVLSGLGPEAWYEHSPRDPTELRCLLDRHEVIAGLVVLDPELAVLLESVGCPTTYVDSLPYLWTDADALPSEATAYCAQMCPTLPDLSWGPLRGIARLHWVGPIIRTTSADHRDPAKAVINLGGLHSPHNPTGNPAYLRLVLAPTIRALTRSGVKEIHLCGNVHASQVGRLMDDLASVGPRSHNEFLDLMASTGLLVTSPGLTTLLEAVHTGTPTVCLPAQNLSQIFNADRFAELTDPRALVSWTCQVLDRDAIERARRDGEDAALAVIDLALRSANPGNIVAELETDVVMAIAHVNGTPTEAVPADLDGVAQVADIVRNVVGTAVAQRLSTGVL